MPPRLNNPQLHWSCLALAKTLGLLEDASGKWRFRLAFPILKMVHDPGGDWNAGKGDSPRYLMLFILLVFNG